MPLNQDNRKESYHSLSLHEYTYFCTITSTFARLLFLSKMAAVESKQNFSREKEKRQKIGQKWAFYPKKAKKNAEIPSKSAFRVGAPDWIRTNDTRRRRPVLYPAGLRAHIYDTIL